MKLTSAEIRSLRAKAHGLNPVVIIGQQGLTTNVHAEIDLNLAAHELIKIRLPAQEKAAKAEVAAEICTQHQAQLVQSIGRVIAIYRQRPGPEQPVSNKAKTKPSKSPRPKAKNPRHY